MKAREKKQILIRVEPEVFEAFDKLCAKEKRSRTNMAEIVLTDRLVSEKLLKP